ncbi:MAG: alanine racemase [Pseudomonadales bacterium]|nr:alanine racemase [Pseudomonadales bacterium]
MALKIEAHIHLDNLRHNLECVRRLAPRSQLLAVVKADAYGHELRGVLPALDGADAFAVAHIDEAMELREHTTRPIVILEGFLDRSEWQLCRTHALTPVLHQSEQLALFEREPPPADSSAWLKIDTGMHRLGFAPAELAAVRQRLLAAQAATRLVAMTHFARSEEVDHPLSAAQIERFDSANNAARLPASMANSGGIIGLPESHRDWVRPGLMLYGVSPIPGYCELRPVMTLTARVIALRDMPAGAAVGYNGRWIAPRATRIATISAGYADGYPTQLPDGTPVLLNGRMARLAGRPSMDMITVDVGELPDVRIGDAAILWGEGLPVETIAAHAGTIAYQLLTGVSKRVTRICL